MPNEVRIRATLDDKVTAPLGRMRDRFDTLGTSKGFQNIVMGVGVGVGAQLWAQASGRIVDVLGDMIQAARDDEVSIQKLGSSLKANIPAWDGNTDAIERVLAARMKLGFSDDEQRDSLAKLVVATHDVNKALEVQRTAMDLARLKGISLAEAGDALTKVEAGQFRALKALGIQLKAGATATDALRAVQAAATGQAEDYAKTNEGRLLVSQVKVNEAMERFGYTVLPLVTDGLAGMADAAVGAATVLDFYQKGLAKTTDGQKEQVEGAGDLLSALGALFPAYGAIADVQGRLVADSNKVAAGFDAAGDNSVNMAEKVKGSAVKVEGATETMSGAAEDWRDKYRDVTGDIIRRSHRVRDALINDAAAVRGEAFDETEIRAELHDQRLALFALEDQKRSAKTAEARRQASDDIVQALDDEGQSLEDLADKGKLTQKDVDRFAKDAKKNYDSLSKEGRADIDALIAKYRALANMPNITKTFTLRFKERKTTYHAPGTGQLEGDGDKNAAGYVGLTTGPTVGPVGWMGEAGTEAVAILRNPKPLGTGGGGLGMGGGVTFQVTVNAGAGSGLSAGDARKLADQIGPALYADMQRRGLLARSGTGLRG